MWCFEWVAVNHSRSNGYESVDAKIGNQKEIAVVHFQRPIAQCAPVFSNPKQKVHWLFHFYISGIYKKDQNQLKKTSDIRLSKFTSINFAEKFNFNEQVLVQKIRFLRITVLEAWRQMVFSTDSVLSYIYLQYKSEKTHGLFGLGWKNQEHTVVRF